MHKILFLKKFIKKGLRIKQPLCILELVFNLILNNYIS